MDIYTDGACSNNGAPNSRAGIGVWSSRGVEISRPLEGKQTNNSAELAAVLAALDSVPTSSPTVIHTDSRYVLIMCNPKREEKRKSYPNDTLISALRLRLAQMPLVSLCHVPAHTGNADVHSIGNAHADRLARAACKLEQVSLAKAEWKLTDDESLLYLDSPQTSNVGKIAAFDIDWTIIRTKSGNVFPKCPQTDWELWSPEVRPAIQKLVSSGYRIVLCSNQSKIGQDHSIWRQKISAVIDALGLSDKVTVLAAITKTSNYRKPRSDMWSFLTKELSSVPCDVRGSLYCGDAAGRPKVKTRKRDFSCSDLKFALNIGLQFNTPEQLFLESTDPLHCDRSIAALGFQPREHWSHIPVPFRLHSSQCQEVIVLVGSPGSGKSTLTKQLCTAATDSPFSYSVISQDILKTKAKCIKATRLALSARKSVIVDGTNRDGKARGPYVGEATRAGVPCRAVWLKATKDEALHLNALRLSQVAAVAIHTYFKNMAPPIASEGFSSVIEVPLTPTFETDAQRSRFFEFTA